jgi:hypothetical protein
MASGWRSGGERCRSATRRGITNRKLIETMSQGAADRPLPGVRNCCGGKLRRFPGVAQCIRHAPRSLIARPKRKIFRIRIWPCDLVSQFMASDRWHHIGSKDFPMPEKTHKESCREAAPLQLGRMRFASNSEGGKYPKAECSRFSLYTFSMKRRSERSASGRSRYSCR